MAEFYSLKVQNATNRALCFTLYQKFIFNREMKSVAWKVISLAPKVKGSPFPEGEIHWTQRCGVCTAQFDTEQRKFIPNQVVTAEFGRFYKVVSLKSTPTISENYAIEDSSQHIVIQNQTSDPVMRLNLGFVVDNSVIAVEEDVGGQEKVSYPLNPFYYVACYHHIEAGQLIDEGAITGPIELRYEPGTSRYVIQAFMKPSEVYSLRHHGMESDTFLEDIDYYSNTHTMMLQNSTDRPWYFGIYQRASRSADIAWKVCGLPPKVSDVPTINEVKWSMEYGLCIARFDSDEQRYVPIQLAPAELHNSYKIVSVDGIPSISIVPTSLRKAKIITITNNSGPPSVPLIVGLTLGRDIIAIEDELGGGQEAAFQSPNSYYVACFHNLIPGQFVTEGVAIGPVEVKYDTSIHTAMVILFKDSSANYQMKVSYH